MGGVEIERKVLAPDPAKVLSAVCHIMKQSSSSVLPVAEESTGNPVGGGEDPRNEASKWELREREEKTKGGEASGENGGEGGTSGGCAFGRTGVRLHRRKEAWAVYMKQEASGGQGSHN